MPKEKKSADAAISAGGDRRSRQLDHRSPLQVAELDTLAREDLVRNRLELRPRLLQLPDHRHERDHDLDLRVEALLSHRAGRLDDRAHLHRIEPRPEDAEPHPPQPEHRVHLVELPHLGEHDLLVGDILAALAAERDLDRQVGEVRQELVQRRIEQAHGHGQTVHRAEDPVEIAASATAGECRRAACSSSSVSARIICCTAATRSGPRNMCSVRHRPMPSAPRSRALDDCSGVSAFARTRRRRRSSAIAISRSNARQIASSRAAVSPRRRRLESGFLKRQLTQKTEPSKPSIVIESPSRTTAPFAGRTSHQSRS